MKQIFDSMALELAKETADAAELSFIAKTTPGRARRKHCDASYLKTNRHFILHDLISKTIGESRYFALLMLLPASCLLEEIGQQSSLTIFSKKILESFTNGIRMSY